MSHLIKWTIRYYRWKIRRVQKKTKKLKEKNLDKALTKYRNALSPALTLMNQLAEEPVKDGNKEVTVSDLNIYNYKKLNELGDFLTDNMTQAIAEWE